MFFRTTSSAIAVLALTAPAFADVTPAEVWQNWVEYYKANGYTVTEGSREEAGETLTLKNVVFAFDAPQNATHVDLTAPQITLTGTGDGKVRSTFADEMPLKIAFNDDEGKPISITGTLASKGFEMLASGSAQDMTHDAKAAELDLTMTGFTEGADQKPLPVTVKLINPSSRQHAVTGANTTTDATFAADRLELSADATEEGTHTVLNGSLDQLAGESTYVLPKGMNAGADFGAAVRAGLALSGKMSAKDGLLDLVVTEKDDKGADKTTTAKVEVKGVDLTVGVSGDGINYQTSTDTMSLHATSPDMPFPIGYAAQSATGDVQIPVAKSDQPQPFKLAYSITGLTIDDAVWNAFDPGKKLPRDPASIDIDLTGLARLNADLFDAANVKAAEAAAGTDAGAVKDAEQAADEADVAASAAADGAAKDGADAKETAADPTATDPDTTPEPFVPTELTINKLAIDAVGAKLDASGTLTIPEGETAATPVGKISARLDGTNALLDKLVDAGLVQSEQVSGLRMMLAMFARPAPEGGDALVSDIELKQGGEVFANGQKIK